MNYFQLYKYISIGEFFLSLFLGYLFQDESKTILYFFLITCINMVVMLLIWAYKDLKQQTNEEY